ncbi:MAG: DUF4215 domain-containing protein [Deltaproteobacteria bacterium]|nr:DUF4215 domain-containing protein [Deltaproteobacteria bacterium]
MDRYIFIIRLALIVASIGVILGCQSDNIEAPTAIAEALHGQDAQAVINQAKTRARDFVDRVQHRSKIRPLINCIERVDGYHMLAHFGYESANDTSFSESVGEFNFFYPVHRDQGQPTTFDPGRHDDVVKVEFGGIAPSVAWKLGFSIRSAFYRSAKCATEPGWLCNESDRDCYIPRCGDGNVDSYKDRDGVSRVETCDDSNTQSSDGCSDTCSREFKWTCDTPGQRCQRMCGNGRFDSDIAPDGATYIETCDDGNAQGDDGCSDACEVEFGWLCDAAGQPCREVYCGDGVVESYTDSNGIYQTEICDDGNRDDSDGCRNSCVPARCGDGVIWTGVETCDDGNAQGGDGCSAECEVEFGWLCEAAGQPCREVYCGDGVVESYTDSNGVYQTEICDDGDRDDTDGCRNSCVPARCGDGVIWTGVETCDDGNAQGGDGCSADCNKVEAGWYCETPGMLCIHECGDGQIESYPDGSGGSYIEACDDGNAQGGDGCSADCSKIEAGWICQKAGQACCTDKCTENDTRCSEMRVQDCMKQANGCMEWTPFVDCPDNNNCIGADCRPGIQESGLTIDNDTSMTLNGNHLYEGNVIIRNSSVLTVPTGKLIIRAQKVVLDGSSKIIANPTGRDPRGQGSGGYVSWCDTCSAGYSYYCQVNYYAQPGCGGYGVAGGSSFTQIYNPGGCLCGSQGGTYVTCVIHNSGGSSYSIADDEIASGAAQGNVYGYTDIYDFRRPYIPPTINAAGGGYIAIVADIIEIYGTITADGFIEEGGGTGNVVPIVYGNTYKSVQMIDLGGGSGGLVFLRATEALHVTGPISAAGTDYNGVCTGGNGVIKILYGKQRSLSGNVTGVEFVSVMPPDDISSSTHPRQNRWYNDEFDTAKITWKKPFAEAEGYYSKVNTTYAFVPGPSNADFRASDSVELSPKQLVTGTNYFHLTTVGVGGELGTVESRFAIKINSTTASISSSTHPNQETWYSNKSPILFWTLPHSSADTSSVYWVLDSYAETLPTVNDNEIVMDPTNPNASSSLQLPAVDDGVWYFHLRAQDTMGYFTTQAAHFRLQIDSVHGAGD